MPSKSQRKNAWRARRREALRNESDNCPALVKEEHVRPEKVEVLKNADSKAMTAWALAVIQWYCSLWEWSKATPHMTRHKQRRFDSLFLTGNYKGIFDQWFKSGRFCYSIAGMHKDTIGGHGVFKETNRVIYDFVDPTLGRYVWTASGSFYRLIDHNWKGSKEEFSVEQEKRSDYMQFVFLHGAPPRKP